MKAVDRFAGAILLTAVLSVLAACTRAPLFIKDLDEQEIQRVSSDDLCRASSTFQETRGRTYPNIENEIVRRGLACGALAQAPAEQSNRVEPVEPAEPAQATVQALRNANMRAGPGTNHSVVGSLRAGESIRVVAVVGSWCDCITSSGQRVFVSCNLLSPPSSGWAVVQGYVAPAVPVSGTTVNLSPYVGRYPTAVSGESDRVSGITFNEHPAVRSAIARATGTARITRFLLDPPGPIGPIVMQRGYIISGGCEAHNCDAHNASLIITPDATRAQVCYRNTAEEGQARWYANGRLVRRTPYCPGWDGSGEVRLDAEFAMHSVEGTTVAPWRLTPIRRQMNDAGCGLYLDRTRRTLAGEAAFGQPMVWTIGLNGQSRQFRSVASTHGMEGLSSLDGSMSITITDQSTIRRSRDPNHPFDFKQVSVEITVSGRSHTIQAYQFCGADQDYQV